MNSKLLRSINLLGTLSLLAAVGLGAYASGMFMLMAHAFYKAALFLAAGVVGGLASLFA